MRFALPGTGFVVVVVVVVFEVVVPPSPTVMIPLISRYDHSSELAPSLKRSTLLPKPISYVPSAQFAGICTMSWKRASPSIATVGSPLPSRGVIDALYCARLDCTPAPPNAADVPPIAVIVSGLSIANSTSTPASGYSPPLFLIVGLTTTLSPALAS